MIDVYAEKPERKQRGEVNAELNGDLDVQPK